MSIILLVLSAVINGSNDQFNGFLRLYGFALGLLYDIVIIGKLLK